MRAIDRNRRAPRRLLLLGACGLGFALAGCGGGTGGYTGPQSAVLLPAHVQKIFVRPVVNRTQFVGLEDKLRFRVEDEFIRDGRIPLVNSEAAADGVLAGEIVNYIREPVSFDDNQVEEEIKLWVIINIRFIDRVNNAVLWEEPRLDQEFRFFVETKPGGLSEEEAREELWDLFARDIVKRTIEGFGSVSGASEREISGDPLPVPGNAPAKPRPRVAPPAPY